ncbi:MAG TPA: hypothetical protein VGP25_18150 [Gemmatimonadaceae bacterium]|jgi:hypothetical protein|nr:hypothetical protein [Gemmatimonadaceae bacterium]
MSERHEHHDSSDRKLDQTAFAEQRAADEKQQTGPRHDPNEIRQHDDSGRDRLFEDRQQHDEAEKNSEKTRLARDVQHHHHPVDDDVADAGSGPSGKRKS